MPESTSPAAPASRVQAPTATDPDAYTRLHITPLDADLLKVVVPASALPTARGISFHTLQTFPEKRYGFVELPAMDAEKIKKKLNGAVLKGSKMRVEKARPEPAAESAKEEETGKKRKKKSSDDPEGTKKRKRDYNVIPGVELEDRKVKRGWTVTDEDKIKALYALVLCKRKGITDVQAQLLWFLQTFLFGVASLSILIAYRSKRQKHN